MAKTDLKKGDSVVVLAGKDKGKKGKILRMIPAKNRAIVEGVNMLKVHARPTRENPRGGIMQVEGSINVTNLMLICPRCNKPTRIGKSILADRTKKRICNKCKEII